MKTETEIKGQHTPGPWRSKATGRNGAHPFGIYGPVHPADGGDYAPIAETRYESDARLIAAAPELLAALKDCLQTLQRLPNVEGAWRLTCLKEVEWAIRKAETGE